jgi:hypothetical protein
MQFHNASPLTLFDAVGYARRRSSETSETWGVYVALYGTVYACLTADAPKGSKCYGTSRDGGFCYEEEECDG